MSTVWIPQVLRAAAGGVKHLEIEGSTVGELVRELAQRHPSVGAQLLTPEGELNRFVNVYVNGQDVRYLAGLETRVETRDEVRLLPAMAGGMGCCACMGRAPDRPCADAPQQRDLTTA